MWIACSSCGGICDVSEGRYPAHTHRVCVWRRDHAAVAATIVRLARQARRKHAEKTLNGAGWCIIEERNRKVKQSEWNTTPIRSCSYLNAPRICKFSTIKTNWYKWISFCLTRNLGTVAKSFIFFYNFFSLFVVAALVGCGTAARWWTARMAVICARVVP